MILPDAVTELDLFAPLPDPDELLRDGFDFDRRGPDTTLLDNGLSQLLPGSTPSKRQKRTLELDDNLDDLDLDFGEDEPVRTTPLSAERSIEIGRREPTPRNNDPTLWDDDGLGAMLDFGEDVTGGDTTLLGQRGGSVQPPADDGMLNFDDGGYQVDVEMNDDLAAANDRAFENARDAAERNRQLQRDSASPLSDLRPSVERDLERTFQLDQQDMEDQSEEVVQAAQRVKRRRVMKEDAETQLHNSQIRKQQEDRSAITRAPTVLPRDPLMLQLMEMQRNGTFVSNLMGDGRMKGWAPELRGILSLEGVKKGGERKRKRDSGVADVGSDEEVGEETPRIEIPQEEDGGFQVDPGFEFGADPTFHENGGGAQLMSDGLHPQIEDGGEDFNITGSPDGGPADFNITEAPLLHPSQSGPVSLGTKNAVHLLREHFAPDHAKSGAGAEPPTPSKRVKSDALFTDLCPEEQTSRQDATKMFFELLVLGTKDAVKVEQGSEELGLPIRVRGKRGLWGDWAEMGMGMGMGAGADAGAGAGEEVVPAAEEVEV